MILLHIITAILGFIGTLGLLLEIREKGYIELNDGPSRRLSKSGSIAFVSVCAGVCIGGIGAVFGV